MGRGMAVARDRVVGDKWVRLAPGMALELGKVLAGPENGEMINWKFKFLAYLHRIDQKWKFKCFWISTKILNIFQIF